MTTTKKFILSFVGWFVFLFVIAIFALNDGAAEISVKLVAACFLGAFVGTFVSNAVAQFINSRSR